MEIRIDELTFQIHYEDSKWQVELETEKVEAGVDLLHIKFHAETPAVPPETEITWRIPNLDIQTKWSPAAGVHKNLPPDWNSTQSSDLADSAPVMAFLNLQGENRMTAAVAEAMRFVQLSGGVNEEENMLSCKVRLFSQPESPLSEYKTSIRLDRRPLFYADAIREVSCWFEGFEEYTPAAVPDAALKSIYSTWYSYHQNLFDKELESECALAAEAGLSGVIVDDGWQTDDNHRKYAFCGDWKVAERRFPDMKGHVEKIHERGMKYILWYAVPYMGCQSANFERFKGKYLFYSERARAGVLDPRFPEVREYLINIYETAVKEWDLDGFKLDFIDRFCFDGVDPAIAENYAGRDIKCLPLAVNKLLSDVMSRLKALKTEILIEFRQPYIGPAIRKYGNMFRAGDCPADILMNRTRTADLRLFSGDTAVHSDMLEWHMEESAEIAARQILNVLFSVPQISIRFAQLPESHRKMLRFWLDFMEQHSAVLLKGRFMPYHPEMNYPLIAVENEEERVIALYQSDMVVKVSANTKTLFIINGSEKSEVILDVEKIPAQVKLCSTCGEDMPTPVLQEGLNRTAIPCSGMMTIHFL